MKQVSTRKNIEINATAEKIFAYISDPRKIALVLPELTEVSNLSSDPLEEDSSYHFKFLMGGSVLNGVCTVEKMKVPTLLKTSTSGLSASQWTHTITPNGDSSTYEVIMEYGIPDGLISEAQEEAVIASNDKAIGEMVERLKTTLEQS